MLPETSRFTDGELKKYAEFEAKMKKNHRKPTFEVHWQVFVSELNSNLDKNPDSKVCIQLGERFMQWVNQVYGAEYAHLRTKIMEQGFGEGKGLEEAGFTRASVDWIDKAMDAYWRDRIYRFLERVGHDSHELLYKDW